MKLSTDSFGVVSNMPASMFTDVNSNCNITGNSNVMQQLALELSNISMLGLDDNNQFTSSQGYHSDDSGGVSRSRSSNMTECVPVPSSEHVAEIVGRQGCKIKALRAKTNTYIKTPVRGEEPVFVVTGRREDVASAKREILSAAEHFSQIRASRRNSGLSITNGNLPPGPPSPGAPGQVTIQVRVPYRVVGLVVGPKGATIKRIQQQTHTYIVTPSRDKEPVFEVTGLPENVESARLEIESHIAMRTGGTVDSQGYDQNDFHANGIDSGFADGNTAGDIFSTMFTRPQSKSVFSAYSNDNILNQKNQDMNNSVFNFPSINTNSAVIGDFNALGSAFSAFSSFTEKSCENEDCLSSPSYDPLLSTSSMWPHDPNFALFSTDNDFPRRSSSLNGTVTTPRLSPTITDSNDFYMNGTNLPDSGHTSVRRLRSDPLSMFGGVDSAFSPFSNMNIFTPAYTGAFSSTGSSPHTPASSNSPVNDSCSPTDDSISPRRRHCIMCSESEIVAALVPCGHNYFCMECANLVVERPPVERQCPLCKECVTQAIRIFS